MIILINITPIIATSTVRKLPLCLAIEASLLPDLMKVNMMMMMMMMDEQYNEDVCVNNIMKMMMTYKQYNEDDDDL